MTMSGGEADKVSVAILGASGYTGAELIRMLVPHPHVSIDVITGQSQAGKPMSDVFPQFSLVPDLPELRTHESVSEAEWKDVDVVFCCLPHATTQEIIAGLPEHLKIVDLSADFRLFDVDVYEQWYGGAHSAPDLQKEAVYGLTELARDKVKTARLVANPGCYPTAAQLPLIPLLEGGLIEANDIIIDAKSGTSGAGRAPKQGTLFCEVADGIQAYGVAAHRHSPEIEQGLTEAAGTAVTVAFTPHLMPMSRGIFETIYVKLAPGKTADDLRTTLEERYKDETFVHVLPAGAVPQTRHVRGSNHVMLSVFEDRLPGRAIVLSAIDNLVKGASGQAIQNMNVVCGFPEDTGLTQLPMFP